MTSVAYLGNSLADSIRECLKDLDYRAEAIYQISIGIAIVLEGLFSLMEQLEDRFGRIGLFESGSKGGFREVCASEFGIIRQGGIDD